MLSGSKFRLRQGFEPLAQNACTAQMRRRPEDRFSSSSAAVSTIKNIDLSRPLQC